MFEFTTKLAVSSILVTVTRDLIMITGITGRDILRLAASTATISKTSSVTNEELRQQIAALDLDQKLMRYKEFLHEKNTPSISISIRSAVDGVEEMMELVERLLSKLDRSLGLDAPSKLESAANLLYFSRKPETNVLTPINSKNVSELRLYAALLDSRFEYLVDVLKLQQNGVDVFRSTYL